MNRLLKILLISTISILLLVGLLFVGVEFTSRPNFCANCHFMETYYNDWKTSTHSDVTCTKCHFPPGIKSELRGKFTAASMVVNYFTGVYKKSKPWAEIEDASCLRSGCHSEQNLDKDVVFKQDIHFNHYSHLNNMRRGKKLRCTSCHSQIVQGEHMTVTETTCFLCHFKNVDQKNPIHNCTWCHLAPIKTDTTEVKYDHSFVLKNDINCKDCHGPMVIGEGDVLENRCNFCHAEVDKIEKRNDFEFVHQIHVTDNKVECERCHLPIQHKSVARTEDIFPDCQECHQTPHEAQFDLFSGTGGKNVPSHPDPMFVAGLNCKACHIFHESEFGLSSKTIATGESCERCHGRGYARIFRNWENNMKEKMNLVDLGFRVLQDTLNVEQLSVQDALLLDDALFNYQLVKNGNVVHNVAYSDELLLQSYTIIQKILSANDIQDNLPTIKLFNTTKPSECQNCHYGQESIKIEKFGVLFDHSKHIGNKDLTCLSCHSHKNTHGETVITRDQCLSCHHNQEEVGCDNCHGTQAHFYDGTIGIYDSILPDYMYEGDVECEDCHRNDDDVITKEYGRNCSNCHDEEYEEYLYNWQDDIKNKILILKEGLSGIIYYDLDKEDRQIVDTIKSGIDKIEKDNSYGVHNYELISDLLGQYTVLLNNL